jgi:hypothetical protein
MDRRTYKSKPQHLVTDPRTGEIKTIVHSSDTNIGSATIPANLTVYGSTSVISQSAQYLSASTIQVKTLVDASGSNYLDNTIFGLRLSLSSSAPIPIVDIASGSTLYLTPYTSGRTSVYNGTQWVGFNTNEISKNLSGLTVDKNYDVFLYLNGSTPAIELSTAWTNDQTRSQALTRQDGVLVKSVDLTRRYVGTVRTVATSAVADSRLKRFVWNFYNRIRRPMRIVEGTSQWTYTGTSFRAANNNVTNSFELVTGDNELVKAQVYALFQNTNNAFGDSVGIGVDSTLVNSADLYGAGSTVVSAVSTYSTSQAFYQNYPGVGYHRFTWLEITGGGSTTWYGNIGNSTFFAFGMTGEVLG